MLLIKNESIPNKNVWILLKNENYRQDLPDCLECYVSAFHEESLKTKSPSARNKQFNVFIQKMLHLSRPGES